LLAPNNNGFGVEVSARRGGRGGGGGGGRGSGLSLLISVV
jgi:hypothetical protein